MFYHSPVPAAGTFRCSSANRPASAATPGLPSSQTILLNMDQRVYELTRVERQARDPFRTTASRHAIYQAIAWIAIKSPSWGLHLAYRRRTYGLPGINGYVPKLDCRLPLKSGSVHEAARRSGYASGFGFEIRMDCPNDPLRERRK